MAFLQKWLDAMDAGRMAVRTTGWPTAVAKVHEWEPATEDGPAITFAYSYEAGGEYYSGEAKIWCKDWADVDRLGEGMTLASFTVRYSPEDPSKSWVDVAQFRSMSAAPAE